VSDPTVRVILPDELGDWLRVPRTAMLGDPIPDEGVETIRTMIEVDRAFGAYDGGPDTRPVGSAGTFSGEITVPGGATITAGAVTAVGVLPTHRRQGHLRRLMQVQLADVVEHDEPVAVLVAAEYPIYGRFGYGPATEACAIRIDAAVPGMWVDPPSGSTELVDNDTFVKLLVDLYDAVRHDVPGHLGYDGHRWEVQTGEIEWPGANGEDRRKQTKVVWRDDAGEIAGLAAYSVKDHWVDNRPRCELRAGILVTATAEAERELIRYFTAVDWTTTVHLQTRPVDDPVPLWLHDARGAVPHDRSDHVWARVLDVPAALTARRYAADGRLVLEIDDPLGFASGRFALEGGPDGALCTPTYDEPDLTLDVKALGAAYLGGHTWHRLAAAGWVREARASALERASTMFATPRAPWCALTF
jgi:predicted acetyltransferase